jgi:galactose mutarotase-like enzyme
MGEELPLHGNISNVPSECHSFTEDEKNIYVKATIRDSSLFSHMLLMERTYTISKKDNSVTLNDKITNIGTKESPIMLLYHCNMGYPLLSENSKVVIDAESVTPRDDHAATDTANCLKMLKPQPGFVEMCYYHDVKVKNGLATCGIYNADIDKGMIIKYNKDTLDRFTEWKMMGEFEYVLGLEPGNCTPDGRDVLRKRGDLKFLLPGQTYETMLNFIFVSDEKDFEVTL